MSNPELSSKLLHLLPEAPAPPQLPAAGPQQRGGPAHAVDLHRPPAHGQCRAWNEGYPKVHENITITEKAPTRHYAEHALTPW